MSTATPDKPIVIYPDSDGQPMSDNTLQFEWIVTIQGGLDALFRDNLNVFVAGDLPWYPVEGDNTIRAAPDAMIAFGRPKGYRGSYRQWEEGGIAPQVVFEVLSPSNRSGEMIRKFRFYERFGVEEFYIFDPYDPHLEGWQRADKGLEEIKDVGQWTSPRLGIRFDLSGGKLRIFGPDGCPFATYVELAEQRDREQRERETAERERETAERKQVTAEREAAEHAARADRLAAKLRELGVDPDA
jgi:Uma2 family endonuclease